MATPAVIYAAKSTPDEHDSVPDQLAACREGTEREGREVVDMFSEDDVSGYRQSRGPKLEAAMAAAKAAAAEHGQAELWVFHSARLARGSGRKNEARALGEVFYDLNRHGVTLRSVQDDPYVTDEAFVGMASKMANKYSEDLSGYVKAGIKRRRAGGQHNGGHIAYGWSVGENGLESVGHQAEIVRRIFSEFVAGKSLTKIARDLQREGVPTAEGGKWGPSTISGILENPVHIGKVRHNGEVFPGLHEGSIDEKVWQQAADLLAARPQIERRGRPPKGRHLFRGGMLRCGCGQAMVPQTKGDLEKYYCNGRSKLGADFCDQKPINRELIDSAVFTYFETVGLDVEATRQQLAEARDQKLREVRALLLDAEGEAQRASERLSRVRRDYTDGKLDAEDWLEFRDQLTGEHSAAAAEVERLRDQEREVASGDETQDVEAETLRKLADLRRAIAGEVQGAEGIDAVRAALMRLFEGFELLRVDVPDEIVDVPEAEKAYRKGAELGMRGRAIENVRMAKTRDDLTDEMLAHITAVASTLAEAQVIHGGYVVRVIPRAEVVEGYDEMLAPILRREPLHQAEKNQRRSSVPS